MGEQLVYDRYDNSSAIFFSADGMNHIPGQGVRAAGLAFSDDLREWYVDSEPAVTVETGDVLS